MQTDIESDYSWSIASCSIPKLSWLIEKFGGFDKNCYLSFICLCIVDILSSLWNLFISPLFYSSILMEDCLRRFNADWFTLEMPNSMQKPLMKSKVDWIA
jgi:hypothetical protein